MSSKIDALSWQQHDARLYLQVGHRQAAAPPLIAALLLGDGGHGLSDNPAADLLRLELDLRRYVRYLASNASDTAEEVAYRSDVITLASAEGTLAGRRHLRMAFELFAIVAMSHITWTNRHRCAQFWISQVRQFVIDANVPRGLLAEAATGWQRRPSVPSYVVMFDSMSAFVSGNMDRADASWWAYESELVGGVSYGDLWRRDGDDDDPQAAPLPRSGPWHLAYLPQTDEVYAARRAGCQPEKVWLLGAGFRDSTHITSVLAELQDHMREPNSLILAAKAVHSVEHVDMEKNMSTNSIQIHDLQVS